MYPGLVLFPMAIIYRFLTIFKKMRKVYIYFLPLQIYNKFPTTSGLVKNKFQKKLAVPPSSF